MEKVKKYNLIIDSREKERANNGLKWFREKDKKKQQWNCMVRALPYGDYLINNEVVFEYKTASDFIQSIYNESLFNEIYNQSNNYLYNYLIIEGDFKESIESSYLRSKYIRQHNPSMTKWRNKANKMITGAIRRCRVRTNIIFCDTEEEAFEEMYYQSKKCLDNKSYGGIVRKTQINKSEVSPNFQYLTGMAGIGDKTADKIINHCPNDSLKSLINLSYEELLEIKGVDRKQAKAYAKWVLGENRNEE